MITFIHRPPSASSLKREAEVAHYKNLPQLILSWISAAGQLVYRIDCNWFFRKPRTPYTHGNGFLQSFVYHVIFLAQPVSRLAFQPLTKSL